MRRLFEAGAVVGLVTDRLGLCGAFATPARRLYPGGRVVLVVGVMLVIAGILEGSGEIVRRVLAWRPLVWIGLVSYGLYLYHVPIFSWMSPERMHLDGTVLLLVRLLAGRGVRRRLVRPGGESDPPRRIAAAPGRIVVPLAYVGVAVVFMASTSLARTTTTRFATSVTLDHYRELVATTPVGASGYWYVGDETAVDLGLQGGAPVDRDGIRGTVAGACGIAGGTHRFDGCAGFRRVRPWKTVYREAVAAFRPDVVVLMTGTTEIFDRRVGGRVLRAGTPEYAGT